MSKRLVSFYLGSLATLFMLSSLVLCPTAVLAQFAPQNQKGLLNVGVTAYETATPKDIRVVVADTIKTILGLVGFVLVVLMLIAGLQYMMAAGNKTKIDGAISRIKNAFIGLIIIMVAYAATVFIIQRLVEATTTI